MVALLHVAAYWALPSTARLAIDRKPTAFDWVFIAPTHEAESIRATSPDLTQRSSATAPAPAPLSTLATPADESSPLPDKPRIDWNSELELVAKSTVPDAGSGSGSGSGPAARRDFGYPGRPTPIKRPPAFAWDRNHINKVEAVPEAIVVHISNNCVMVFMPFPLIGCGIGQKPANGHLLDHMPEDPAMAEAPAP